MAVNKVTFNTADGERTLIDLTGDTATADAVLKGATFHGSDGEVKTGSFTLSEELSTQDTLIAQIKWALQGKAASGGESIPTQEKSVSITENGTTLVTPDIGYALSMVTVNVDVPIPDGYIKPSGTKSITENGKHDVKQYEEVTVNVPIPDGYIQPSGTKEITENGTHDVTAYKQVTVNVPSEEPLLQEKTVTENGEVTPDAGYDGLGKVVVNVAASGGGENQLHALLDGSLTALNSTVAKVLGHSCRGRTAITSVNLPNATSIGTYAFYGCSGITSLNAPNVTSLGTYAFNGCNKLTEVNFPKATSIPSTCFYQCTALKQADFGAAKSIAGNAFAYCNKLQTLILRYTGAVVTLNSTSFSGAAYDGYIYVPAALIDSYKVASNWSVYASLFRAIEDYPDICGT